MQTVNLKLTSLKMEHGVLSQFEFHHSLVTSYVVLLLSILFFGLLANVLLCSTICCCMKRTPGDMYIFAMSTTQCIASLPAVLTIDNVLYTWTTGENTCKIVYYLLCLSYHVVSCILLILHLDEYMKLKHLKYYQACSISKYWKMVMVITLTVLSVCNIPQLIYRDVKRGEITAGSLVCSYDNNTFAYKLHSTFSITIHLMTFILTFTLNIFIRRKLYCSPPVNSTSGGNAILQEKRKQSLKILSVLFLLNFALASPQVFLEFVQNYIQETSSNICLFLQFLYFSRYFCSALVYLAINRQRFNQAKDLLKYC